MIDAEIFTYEYTIPLIVASRDGEIFTYEYAIPAVVQTRNAEIFTYEYVTPTPPNSIIKVWNGSAWVRDPFYYWNGTAWVQAV